MSMTSLDDVSLMTSECRPKAFDIALVLDESGSMLRHDVTGTDGSPKPPQFAWYTVRDLVIRMLQNLASHHNIRVALTKFSDDVKTLFSLNDHEKMLYYLETVMQPFDFRSGKLQFMQ